MSVELVTIICLECDDPFDLNYKPRRGQVITCPMCDSEMEVLSVDPLRLEFYYEGDWDDGKDDWDDEDLDDDEDDWD